MNQYAQGEFPNWPGSIQIATSAEMARNIRAVASQRSTRRVSPGLAGAWSLEKNRPCADGRERLLTTTFFTSSFSRHSIENTGCEQVPLGFSPHSRSPSERLGPKTRWITQVTSPRIGTGLESWSGENPRGTCSQPAFSIL